MAADGDSSRGNRGRQQNKPRSRQNVGARGGRKMVQRLQHQPAPEGVSNKHQLARRTPRGAAEEVS